MMEKIAEREKHEDVIELNYVFSLQGTILDMKNKTVQPVNIKKLFTEKMVVGEMEDLAKHKLV